MSGGGKRLKLPFGYVPKNQSLLSSYFSPKKDSTPSKSGENGSTPAKRVDEGNDSFVEEEKEVEVQKGSKRPREVAPTNEKGKEKAKAEPPTKPKEPTASKQVKAIVLDEEDEEEEQPLLKRRRLKKLEEVKPKPAAKKKKVILDDDEDYEEPEEKENGGDYQEAKEKPNEEEEEEEEKDAGQVNLHLLSVACSPLIRGSVVTRQRIQATAG